MKDIIIITFTVVVLFSMYNQPVEKESVEMKTRRLQIKTSVVIFFLTDHLSILRSFPYLNLFLHECNMKLLIV